MTWKRRALNPGGMKGVILLSYYRPKDECDREVLSMLIRLGHVGEGTLILK